MFNYTINRILLKLVRDKVLKMKDEKYLKLLYKQSMKKELNLDNPQTFNEKLQWLKLFDRQQEYIKIVDKYEVKKYISDKIGNEFIIPTIGIYNNFKEINFDELPNQFVIKTTHYGGGKGVYIIKDKNNINKKKIKKELSKLQRKNLYYYGREWPYKNVKPRIIIEKYLEDASGELKDYKFFCFNGKVEFFKIDFDRFTEHHANYYDTNLHLLPFGESMFPPIKSKKMEMPINLDKMISLAEKLSIGIPFIRVDLYNLNGKIYFGELTLYPASGFEEFEPEEYDLYLGNMLELPK